MYKFFIKCVIGLMFVHAPAFAGNSRADDIHSNIAYVVDVDTGEVLVDRNSSVISPIASISKLMASIVVLDSDQGLMEQLRIEREDIAQQSSAKWKLKVGTEISRKRTLRIGLMSSENRAINALARSYAGGGGCICCRHESESKRTWNGTHPFHGAYWALLAECFYSTGFDSFIGRIYAISFDSRIFNNRKI